jgi:glycosyltransferase involved in cell wall biosynthesis
MRILFPTLTRLPSLEAPAVQVANMAQAFAELGHDVTLVAPAPDPTLARTHPAAAADPALLLGFTPTFRIRVLSPRIHRGQSYLHALRLARAAAPGRTDLVFSRNLRACLLPALRGVPTVFEAHTLDSLTGPQERFVLRRLLRSRGLRTIVAISQALADDLSAELDIDPARITVAHDAVRPDTPAGSSDAPAGRAASAARDRPTGHASTGPRFRVGYTGALFPGKGVETIVATAPLAPWAEFHVVGGPDELADALRQQLAAPDAPDNVVVHGAQTPARIRVLQGGFDVLIAPFSRRVESDAGTDIARWTSPMKLFEYLASGRPVVVSDLPVLREVVTDGVDVLAVPPDDAAALANALTRLRDDPALGERLAAEAGRRVRAEHTWDVRARRILAAAGLDAEAAAGQDA